MERSLLKFCDLLASEEGEERLFILGVVLPVVQQGRLLVLEVPLVCEDG